MHFALSPAYEFHCVIRSTDEKARYRGQLKYMFGGDFGFMYAKRCVDAYPDMPERGLASVDLRDLHFYEQLHLHGEPKTKNFVPYRVDVKVTR